MNVQRLPFLQGWYWIVGGWKLFLRKPLTWIVFTLILWFIVQLSGVHWLLASAVAVFLPVFIAGWARACEAAERGESVPVPMLFEGFRRRFGELSAVGGFNAIGNILVLLVVIAFGGDVLGQIMSDPTHVDPDQFAQAYSRIMSALFIGVMIGVPVAMAVLFAPFGIALDGLKPAPALVASLRGMARNTMPFLLYGAVWVVVAVVLFQLAALFLSPPRAFGLAIWAVLPVLVPSVYVSYRDIFRLDETAETVV